jgi:hypothetical protein
MVSTLAGVIKSRQVHVSDIAMVLYPPALPASRQQTQSAKAVLCLTIFLT